MIETVDLDHDPRSARTARRLVARHLTGHDTELVDSVTLMVSELVTNSVKHSKAPCSITFELTTALVRVEVRDAGPDVPAPRSPTHNESSGRGLHIVAALADDWGIGSTTAGNAVWFRVDLDATGAARVRDVAAETDKSDVRESSTPIVGWRPPPSTMRCVHQTWATRAVSGSASLCAGDPAAYPPYMV